MLADASGCAGQRGEGLTPPPPQNNRDAGWGDFGPHKLADDLMNAADKDSDKKLSKPELSTHVMKVYYLLYTSMLYVLHTQCIHICDSYMLYILYNAHRYTFIMLYIFSIYILFVYVFTYTPSMCILGTCSTYIFYVLCINILFVYALNILCMHTYGYIHWFMR